MQWIRTKCVRVCSYYLFIWFVVAQKSFIRQLNRNCLLWFEMEAAEKTDISYFFPPSHCLSICLITSPFFYSLCWKREKNPLSLWNEACTDRTTYPQPITHTEQKYSISFNRNRWTTPYFSRKLRRNCLVIWIKFQNTFSICYKK